MSETKKTPAVTIELSTAKKPAEKKVEPFDPKTYETKLKSMSHRQLVGELSRLERQSYGSVEGKKGTTVNGVDFNNPKQRSRAGLSNAFATVLRTVLENTKTKENPKGRLHCYPV
jgi:hypothetical protein